MRLLIIIIFMTISNLANNQYEDVIMSVKQEEARMHQASLKAFQKEAHCLAENIIYEAGNQSTKGKIAVAQVTINRKESGLFPKSVCDVVYQKKQFSWTALIKKPKYDKVQYNEAYEIAVSAIQKKLSLPELKHSLFYHATYVSPIWRNKLVRVAKIGDHIFYQKKDYDQA